MPLNTLTPDISATEQPLGVTIGGEQVTLPLNPANRHHATGAELLAAARIARDALSIGIDSEYDQVLQAIKRLAGVGRVAAAAALRYQ